MSSPPDVAFIDLNMPDPDGAELARMIRQQPWGQSVKLVALTGMGEEEHLERTRPPHFDERLMKPADPNDLLRTIAAPRADAPAPVAKDARELGVVERSS